MRKTALMIALLALVLGISACADKVPMSYADAKAEAAKLGKPLLVDFSTAWCSSCKTFAREAKEDADVMKSLESVYLFPVDAEKGEGVELAKEFKIRAFPSFILVNSDGETLDRWVGYSKDMHLETLDASLADLTTIDQKLARYNEKPTVNDAVVLGRYSYALGEYKEAVAYYSTAQQLEDTETDYSYQIFNNTYSGVRGEHFTFDDVTAAADNVLSSEGVTPKLKVITAMRVTRMAKQQDRIDIVESYIEAGLKLVSGNDDPDSKEYYNDLMVEKSLHVTRDKEAAVKYKRANLKDGWQDDAGGLNGFAWWCFENLVNLEEAEQLARKGAELAKPGREKAMILDTVAEICNALDNHSEAVEFAKLAVAENPEEEFFQKQVQRFEEILASAE